MQNNRIDIANGLHAVIPRFSFPVERTEKKNGINNKRREEPFVENYEQTFGVRLPHQDTIAEVLCKLDPGKLEQVKMDLTSNMFDQKWLRHYRLQNKYYTVAIDATGVVSFDHRHCEHCLTKTSKKGVVTITIMCWKPNLLLLTDFVFPWLRNGLKIRKVIL